MIKYFVVISVLLVSGQLQEIEGNNYNNMQAEDLDSVHRILFEATAEAASNTPNSQREIIRSPCANRRSGGDSQGLQVPSQQMKSTQAPPKFEGNLIQNINKPKCKQDLDDVKKSDQETLDQIFEDTTDDSKTGIVKLGCKSSRRSKDSNVDQEIQNKINNNIAEEQNANNNDYEIMDFRTGLDSVENNVNEKDSINQGTENMCGRATKSYENENSRRFMGDDTDSNILPSGYGETNRDISKYQHNLNLGIRNQLLAQMYNKGQISSSGNDMNSDYSDYPMNQYVTSPNIQKNENPQNENVKVVKNHHFIEVSEKIPQKVKQQNLKIEQKAVSTGKLSRVIGTTKDKTSGNSATPMDSRPSRYSDVEDQLMQPTKGAGLLDKAERRVSLIENPRVCYACSSTNDVNCWIPNRQTTVKYCRKEHDACVTKTYKTKDQGSIVVRDCSSTCDVTNPMLETKYASCSICKNDLCNHLYVGNNASGLSHGRSVLVMILIAGFYKIFL